MDKLKLYWRIIKAIKPLLGAPVGMRFPVMTDEEEAVIDAISKAADGTRFGEIIHEVYIRYYSNGRASNGRDLARYLYDRGVYPWPENGPSPTELLMNYCDELERRTNHD